MALQRKERCIRLKQRNNRCVKFLKCDEHFENETVPNRRYEAELKTKRNEQIFDLTGGRKKFNFLGFY